MLLDREISLGHKTEPSPQAIIEIAEKVQNGAVVVFPWGKLERRCLALMANSADIEACRHINRIKTRDEQQVLAVNGYPELIAEVAKIEESEPLIAASERLRINPTEVIRRIMTRGAVSFIFEARDNVPDTVTQPADGVKTIMVAGEIDNSGFDFYTELIKKLHERGVITAGTSANRTTTGTYHVFEQMRAYEDLARDIDIFVYDPNLPPRPIHAINLESCSTFDMRVKSAYPNVTRFGSVHPARFKDIIRGYTVAATPQYLPHHEKLHHILLKALLNFLVR